MFKQINLAQMGCREKPNYFILAQIDCIKNELIILAQMSGSL